MNRLTDDYKCHTPPLATNKVPFVTPPQECLIAPPVQVPSRMDEEENNDEQDAQEDGEDEEEELMQRQAIALSFYSKQRARNRRRTLRSVKSVTPGGT